MNNRTIDQIIDANMTVTDHLLRDAIHAVVVDAIYEAVEQEREAIAKEFGHIEVKVGDSWVHLDDYIRARGEP